MRRYSSFRYQAVLDIIICHAILVLLVRIFHFFGGFDNDEFIELISWIAVINFFYVIVLLRFRSSRNWFLPNPTTFDRTWTYIILFLVGVLVWQKAFFNIINFVTTVTIIKLLELFLFLLGNKKKKTPSGL